MNLKKSLFIALAISLVGLVLWESYWRTKPEYYKAYLEDGRYLWSEHRAKVEDATHEDVILLGSSRSGYNFNTHIWEEVQCIKPINLSANGKPAGPFLKDIIDNTSFNGTIVYGVPPIAFFGFIKGERWQVAQQWVDHYHNETYAQKLGHQLSKPLQRNLVMLSSAELSSHNDLDLKSLINTIKIPGRIESVELELINFGYNDEDRNLILFPRMIPYSIAAKEITDEWDKVIPTLPEYEVVKNQIPKAISLYKSLIDKFESRGGKIIFIRHKSEEDWNKYIQRMYPKDKAWDKFVNETDCPTYHFEDYQFMSKYTLPDWSHMREEDAKTYTRDMVNQLIKDGHLKKH